MARQGGTGQGRARQSRKGPPGHLTMVPSMIFSSLDIGPIFSSRSLASCGEGSRQRGVVMCGSVWWRERGWVGGWGAALGTGCVANTARGAAQHSASAAARTRGASGVSLISGANRLYMMSGVTSRPARAGTTEACQQQGGVRTGHLVMCWGTAVGGGVQRPGPRPPHPLTHTTHTHAQHNADPRQRPPVEPTTTKHAR